MAARVCAAAVVFSISSCSSCGGEQARKQIRAQTETRSPALESVGAKVGEVTTNSALIQSYLLDQPPDTLLRQPYAERVYPGQGGWVSVEYSSSPLSADVPETVSPEEFAQHRKEKSQSRFTVWRKVPTESPAIHPEDGTAEVEQLEKARASDFSFHQKLHSLEPGTEYFFRLWMKMQEDGPLRAGGLHRFRTAPAAAAQQDVSFISATCFNHSKVKDLEEGLWPVQGFRMFKAILREKAAGRLAFDFAVFNGDTVYLDKQVPRYRERPAYQLADIRARYLDTYITPLAREFFAQVPAYFQKDDHDWRFNDADPVFNPTARPPQSYSAVTKHYRGPPGPGLGKEIFEEMHPLERDGDSPPYRAFRWGRGLQMWILESRECRYPNDPALGRYQIRGLLAPQAGPTPNLKYPEYCGVPAEDEEWGKKQFDWLLQGLKQSDADFKIIISPTPVFGPDQDYYVQLALNPILRKADNQVRRFRKELTRFLEALQKENLKNVYFVSGDRHFIFHSQYTTRDGKTSLQEFGAGPFADDIVPLGKVFYEDDRGKSALLDSQLRSGFAHVQIKDASGNPRIVVEWYAIDWKTTQLQKWGHRFEAALVR